MNWLRRFMYGRYGTDQLNWALLILSLLISLATSFTTIQWLRLLYFIPMVLVVYRMFSRQIAKRRAENDKFMKIWYPISNGFRKFFARRKDKQYKYFRCPKCKTQMRAPRNKGKIRVHCAKCGETFVKNT